MPRQWLLWNGLKSLHIELQYLNSNDDRLLCMPITSTGETLGCYAAGMLCISTHIGTRSFFANHPRDQVATNGLKDQPMLTNPIVELVTG